jgi:uncharacterized protein (TIRG00374 family)
VQHPTDLRRWGRLTLGILLSAVFLVLAFKDVPFSAVWQALRRADALCIALALLCVNAVNVVKAVRWQAILHPQSAKTSLSRLFAVIMIGQAMNAFAPVRVGDLARAYMVKGIGAATVLYSVVVEKAWDSLILLATLAWVALVMPLPAWLKQSGIAFSAALVAVLALLALAGRYSRLLVGAAQRLEDNAPPLRRLSLARRAGAAGDVMRALGQGRTLATVLLWTVAGWVLGIAANYLTFAALGMQVTNAPVAATFLIIVLYLGAIIPSSPGKVGVFHYLVVISLALFGVDKAAALSYAVVLHLIVYGPTALLGAFYVWRGSQTNGRG